MKLDIKSSGGDVWCERDRERERERTNNAIYRRLNN
jgi:hypothetical protein